MANCFIVLVIIHFCTCNVLSMNNSNNGEHVVDKILSADTSKVPSEVSGVPVEIGLKIFFTQMRSHSHEEVDYTFYMYQSWMDPRLQWGNKNDTYYVIRPNLWKNLWLPDTYIENELKSFIHDISAQNKFVWVVANGTVVYGIRLTATMSCKFGAMRFPTAYFLCKLKYRIHSYETRDVRLHWFSKSIDFAEDFAGDNIELINWDTHNCTLDRSSVIINSCLQIRMLLKKNFGSTALRTYLPSIFIIIVGWLNFWIDRKEVSARVKLGTLVLLAMITEGVGINFLVPSGVTVSSLDVWFAVLLSYTTLVMIEFTIVHSIDRYQKKLKVMQEQKESEEANHSPEPTNSIQSVESISKHPDEGCTVKRRYKMQIDERKDDKQPLTNSSGCFYGFIATVSTGKIEKYARIIYFVSFAIFQIFYWGFYLSYTEIVLD